MNATSQLATKLKVMIVEDDTLVALWLRSQLENMGHDVVGHASSRDEAVEQYAATPPDLVLMDISLGDDNGLDVAAELMAARPVPMIVVSAFSDGELIQRAADVGVFGYLVKPVNTDSLAAQIAVARQRFAERQRLTDENESLSNAIENRKLIEKAKGLLMHQLKLSEAEAHRRLQVECQKRRITVAEMARRVIDSKELLGR